MWRSLINSTLSKSWVIYSTHFCRGVSLLSIYYYYIYIYILYIYIFIIILGLSVWVPPVISREISLYQGMDTRGTTQPLNPLNPMISLDNLLNPQLNPWVCDKSTRAEKLIHIKFCDNRTSVLRIWSVFKRSWGKQKEIHPRRSPRKRLIGPWKNINQDRSNEYFRPQSITQVRRDRTERKNLRHWTKSFNEFRQRTGVD